MIDSRSRRPKSLENINAFFYAAAKRIINARTLILTLTAIVLVFSIIGLSRLRLTVSVDSFFLSDDPLIEKRDRFESIFENNDFIGVLIESNDVFSAETVQMMHDLSIELEKNVPYFNSIVSIPTTSSVLLGGSRFVFKDGKLANSRTEIEDLRSRFDKRKSLRGVLYTDDYKEAWILVRLNRYPDGWAETGEEPAMYTGRKAMEVVKKFQDTGADIIPTGVPVLAYRKSTEMFEDLVNVLVLAGVFALVCIVFLIRVPAGIVGALIVAASAICIVFGGLGWLGIPADTTFMLVPMLLTIAVSIGYTIHVSNFFNRRFRETGKRKESVLYAIQETGWPVLFTALTTIVALLSFMFVSIYPIRWVGLVSSASISFVYVLTMFFFCALLSIGPDKETEQHASESETAISHVSLELRREKREEKSDKVFGFIGSFLLRYGKVFVPIFGILLVICGFGLFRLRVNLNTNKIMGTKLPHARDQMYVGASEIGTILSYDIAIQFVDNKQTITLSTLKKIDELSDFVNDSYLIKGNRSITQSLREFHQIRNNDDPEHYTLPPTDSALRALVNYYSRIPGNDLKMWLSEDQKSLRVFVQVYEMSSSDIEKHIQDVKAKLAELFPESEYPQRDFLITGSMIQLSMMNQYVTSGLITSVGIALVTISVILMVVFRSIPLGLIAMIPNIAPVIVAGGLMGFFNVELEFVTMTIAPMLLGLAVDDTIHVISHIRLEYSRTGDYNRAISETFLIVGKAITQTTFILCIIFAAFSLSRVRSIVNMGIFTIAGMLAALAADFVITPVLVRWTKPLGRDR